MWKKKEAMYFCLTSSFNLGCLMPDNEGAPVILIHHLAYWQSWSCLPSWRSSFINKLFLLSKFFFQHKTVLFEELFQDLSRGLYLFFFWKTQNNNNNFKRFIIRIVYYSKKLFYIHIKLMQILKINCRISCFNARFFDMIKKFVSDFL